jgi:ATP-dependent Zn protease
MLSLSNDKLDDNMLAQNFRDAPQSAILLLEDVDAVFVNRDKGSGSKSGVSFSGLLNAIDGVASQEGRIFFMTTNHLERLDEALIRPGRCDVRVELKKASKGQMERLFLRFFPDAELEAKEFALKLPTNEISMAQLQGHLLEHKTSAQVIYLFFFTKVIQIKKHTKMSWSENSLFNFYLIYFLVYFLFQAVHRFHSQATAAQQAANPRHAEYLGAPSPSGAAGVPACI